MPEHIDYDLWSGPALLTPPRRNSQNGTVHYDWHWFWNYGGGDITNTKDSFARMMDHLKANEVNTHVTATVVGPLLQIDRATEMFTGGEKVITDNANRNPLRKRTGRQPFTIPEFKA